MSMHNLFDKLNRAEMPATGEIFKAAAGFVHGWGTTVGNGVQGWAPGAIFIDTNAASPQSVWVNTGSKTAATWASISPQSGTAGFLNLDINSFTLESGVALAVFSDGASATPGYSATAEGIGIRWNNHATPTPIQTSFPYPPDLDPANDVVLHVLAYKTGATVGDAVTWTCTAFENVAEALFDADADFGGASSAMTGDAATKTVQEETLTLAAANITGSPGSVALTIQPTDGTLGTDDVTILSVWLEYTKRIPA